MVNFPHDVIGKSFYRAWNDFYHGWYIDPVLGKTDLREQVFAGGRGSLKSSAASVFIVLGMERDAKEAAFHKMAGDSNWKSYLTHCVAFRKIAADLSTSIYAQFEWAINKLNLQDKYALTKSPLRIVRLGTNQTIYFRGLDDPTKVKSIKSPFGYFKYLIFEEADQFDGMEEIRNVRQSVLRGGHKFQTFMVYNPPETSAHWLNHEMSLDVPGRVVYRSNYLTVPRSWLSENFFIEADILRKTNYRAYAHEYLGEITGNGGSVFPNVKKLRMTDEMISQFSNRRFGVDWGFAIDPACWIAIHYDKTRRSIYIYDEIYGTGMTNPEFAAKIKQKDMGFSYLMCDSAEPKSIAEFEGLGINALPAQKGPDSVRFSTKWLQGLINIYIDPDRCPNTFREFTQYEYQKNKSGMFISRFPDLNNHGIDATRYAMMEDAVDAGMF